MSYSFQYDWSTMRVHAYVDPWAYSIRKLLRENGFTYKGISKFYDQEHWIKYGVPEAEANRLIHHLRYKITGE